VLSKYPGDRERATAIFYEERDYDAKSVDATSTYVQFAMSLYGREPQLAAEPLHAELDFTDPTCLSARPIANLSWARTANKHGQP
jgi:hypothetical protein